MQEITNTTIEELDVIITDKLFEETNGEKGIYIKIAKTSITPEITDELSLTGYFENAQVLSLKTDFANKTVKAVIGKVCKDCGSYLRE
jgi:hypothetical protein